MGVKQFIAIDLKSFYASVECAERGLDPLDTNLVVADESRTDKTICLAVSPSLKAIGVPGRPRLFEAKQKIREANAARLHSAPGRRFSGKSVSAAEIAADPSLEIDTLIAVPRMRYYMEYSRKIVEIYMKYVSPEDILVYSVDEVFIDATHYLRAYGTDAHGFAMMMIRDVLKTTRITATAGIGTNMYLAKIAMDIVAKKMPPDSDGVRIASLDERSYREKLWCHRPLTDFWRIGHGIASKLEQNGMYTMGDVARCSVGRAGSMYSEELLYKLFGVNAELLIDHAWGWENTEIADCRSYRPESRSLSQGQVLSRPYKAAEGRVVVSEMADSLSSDLVRQGLFTDQVVLDVVYDAENLKDDREGRYRGAVETDYYGRRVPKAVHGSRNLGRFTSSASMIISAVCGIYDECVDSSLTVRRFNISVNHLIPEGDVSVSREGEQLDIFTDYEELDRQRREEDEKLRRELRMQKAIVGIRDRFGKNAIVKGLNMQEGATAIERNKQIGGHRS